MGSGTFYPAVGGDDGRWFGTNFSNSTTYGSIGHNSGASRHCFFRFPNVTIPQGSTISSAIVRLTCYFGLSATVVRLNVYLNNVDNAVAPTTYSEADGLALTSEVAWDGLSAWVTDVQYDTPGLNAILQDVVGRAGWSSGNAVQVLIKNDDSNSNCDRYPSFIEHSSGSYKAELHVVWGNPITGELAATLPAITAEIIEGNMVDVTLPAITAEMFGGGQLEATLPAITAEMQGGGALEATLPAITAEMEGTTSGGNALEATLPAITAELSGCGGGFLEATLPAITAEMKGGAALNATLPAITAYIEGDVEILGNLEATLPAITANLEGRVNVHGDLVCTLPAITAELTGTVEVGGSLVCILPAITAELTGFQDISGELIATLPAITALIEGTTGLADDDGDPVGTDECGIILRYSKVGY